MFTKQHYEAIAEIIHKRTPRKDRIGQLVPNETAVLIAADLADYFIQDNPQFDRERFLSACGIEGS